MRIQILAVIAVIAMSLPAAAAPTSIQLQGSLFTSSGLPANGKYDLTIGVYDKATAGALIWTGTLSQVTVTSGLFDAVIGPLTVDDLDGAERWVEVRVDSETPLPRRPLLAVPYAVMAEEAEGLRCSGCVDGAEIAADAIVGSHIVDGSVGKDDVSFKYALGDAKGGGAIAIACTDCIGDAQLSVTYAGSTSQGGPASDVACTGPCVSESEVDFPWAVAASPGGAATKLECTGCVGGSDIAEGAVTSFHIQNGSVAAADVAFPWAKGTEANGDAAGLTCNGCVGSTELADTLILGGDLTVAGGIDVGGELNLGGGLKVNGNQVVGLRFENSANAPVTCNAQNAGYAYFDTASKALTICDGAEWTDLLGGSDSTVYRPSCREILDAGESTGDGLYTIKPGNAPFDVFCDMTTDGGGWLVLTTQHTNGYFSLSESGGNNVDKCGYDGMSSQTNGAYAHDWYTSSNGCTYNVSLQYYSAGNLLSDQQVEDIRQTIERYHPSSRLFVADCDSDGYELGWEAWSVAMDGTELRLTDGASGNDSWYKRDFETIGELDPKFLLPDGLRMKDEYNCSNGGGVLAGWRSGEIRLRAPDPGATPGDGKSKATAGLSCSQLLQTGFSTGSHTYWIDPNGGDTADAFEVFCDMVTDGGGWVKLTTQHSHNYWDLSYDASNNANKCGYDGLSTQTNGSYTHDAFTQSNGCPLQLTLVYASNGRMLSDANMDALRAIAENLHPSTALFAADCDSDGYEPSWEAYSVASDGSKIRLTNGASSNNSWYGVTYESIDEIPADYLLPAKFKLNDEYSCSNGGGVLAGWTASHILVRDADPTSVAGDGKSRYTAALNCKAILDGGFSTGDHLYWLDTTGGSSSDAFREHCDMTTSGGGWTRAFKWDRENDGDGVAELKARMSKVYDDMTELTDWASNRIRWSDLDSSADALAYSATFTIPNGGEALLRVHYYAYSMDNSATWFSVESAAGLTDVLCREDLPSLDAFSSAELGVIPYSCATTGSGSWTWDSAVQKVAPSAITGFHMRSLHHDAGHGDYSELYRMELLVR